MYKIIKTAEHYGHVLHRIEAIESFNIGDCLVIPGDKGGWIENLQENAWVDGDAVIWGNAKVMVYRVMPKS